MRNPTAGNLTLIERAGAMLRPHRLDDHRFAADVASLVVSADGNDFAGVCIDVPSGSLCAEQSAIAAMVTAGKYQISTVVAVTRIGGVVTAIAPCGKCREFMHQVHEANLDAAVILGPDRAATLRQLLPEHLARLNLGRAERHLARAALQDPGSAHA